MGMLRNSRQSSAKPWSKGSAICLIIIGLVVGTAFMGKAIYWERPITKDQAVPATAHYLSYSYEKGNAIFLTFSDLDVQCIDAACVTTSLLEWVDRLKPDSQLILLLHPNSQTVLQIEENGETILDFADAIKMIQRSDIGFILIGLLLYGLALIGRIKIVRKEVR